MSVLNEYLEMSKGDEHSLMKEQSWVTASLRIISEIMTIEEITTTLHLMPSDVRVKGTLISRHNPSRKVWKYNCWILASELTQDKTFAEHCDALLEKIEPSRQQLYALADRCGVLDFCTGYSSGERSGKITIDNARIARLAQMPFSLTFDLYPPLEIKDDDTGEDLKRSRGALTIFSSQRSCAQITSLLTLEPTLARGDASSQEQVWWLRESGLPSSALLEDHFDALLAIAEERTAAFEQLRNHASMELRLCFASSNGQGGFGLDNSDVKRLATLPFDLSIKLTLPLGLESIPMHRY